MKNKDISPDEPDRLRPFRVGEWCVHPEFNEIRGPAGSVRLQPRLIQVLRLLALTPGRTLSRDALIDGAWSRRMVNDEVLSRTIADLRQALGDDARQPRYLETIPKLGYRLIAKVEWLDEAVAPLPQSATPLSINDPAPAEPEPVAAAVERWAWPAAGETHEGKIGKEARWSVRASETNTSAHSHGRLRPSRTSPSDGVQCLRHRAERG